MGIEKPSEGQIEYIREGFRQNIRGDGRKNDERREVVIEKGVLKQANGSCLIKYGDGSGSMYIGIKVEIGESKVKEEGQILLKIESAQRREQNRELEQMVESDKNTLLYIEQVLNISFVNNIDKKSLWIPQSNKCWILYVDVFLLEAVQMSNMETISIGIGAALEDLVLPKVIVAHNNLTNEDEITLVEEQLQTFQLSQQFRPPSILQIGQLNRILVHDMNNSEYHSVDSKYMVVIDTFRNKVISIKKTGAGFIPPEDFAKIAQFALLAAQRK